MSIRGCNGDGNADRHQDNVTNDRLGLRCPEDVYQEVQKDAASSASGRRAAVKVKDDRDIGKARSAILRLFPQMPLASCQEVLDHGFQKGSGRVGRSTVLDDDEKVTLAIVAHVRHKMTPYDTLLRELDRDGVEDDTRRETARAMIRSRIDDVLSQWRSSSSNIVLKPIGKRPNSKRIRGGQKLKTQSQKAVRSDIKGSKTTEVMKSKKEAAGPSLEASMHAVKSNFNVVYTRDRPARAPAKKLTASQKTTASAVTRGSARTTCGSKRGFSAAHMTNSLEASMHAIGSFTKALLETNEVSRRSSRGTYMTGTNTLECSIHALNYDPKAAPPSSSILMNIDTRPMSSPNMESNTSQKKRSRGMDEDTSRVKRCKYDNATAGAPTDLEERCDTTVVGLPKLPLEDVDDRHNLLPFLDAMHLGETPDQLQCTFASPILPHKSTSGRTAGRLIHPTRRQLLEMKNGNHSVKKMLIEASNG